MDEMLDLKELETQYDDIGRIYLTSNNKYYSVTTMLSHTSDHSFLDEWRERVGHEEADRITRVAANLGQHYHDLGEQFLLRKPLPKRQWMAEHLFKGTEPILRKNITNVHAVECCLYSDRMMLAGRTDAIVDWRKELAVFDFKCIGHHNSEWLEGYWIQTTIYREMLKEMTGLEAKKLVLVCANKKNLKTKSFTESPTKYAKEAVKRIKKFRQYLKEINA